MSASNTDNNKNIANVDKTEKLLNDHYKNVINNIVGDIKKIADSDTSDKSDDVKAAEACFKLLGQQPSSKCPHGLEFFQCMPCSH